MSYDNFNIVRFDSIDSTNSYALSNIDILAHNTLVIASLQTAGRGRLERTWVSNSTENIYFSLVIKPTLDYKKLPLVNFTQLFSVVIAQVIASYGVIPQIKWPNDILIGKSKLVGILSEVAFKGGDFKGLVVGVGINFAEAPGSDELDRQQPATSLQAESIVDINRDEFISKILKNYLVLYDDFCERGFSSIKELYLEFFPFIGKEIEVTNSNQNGSGKVIDISEDGELIIDDSGTLRNIVLGDMIWESL